MLSLSNIFGAIRTKRMRGVGTSHVQGEREAISCRILVRKIEEKGILEDYVAWIHEALVRDNIQSLLNRVMQFCGLMHGG